MCVERIVRNFGFATASLAIVAGLGYIIEYLPLTGLGQ
jgi:hypothetical protein